MFDFPRVFHVSHVVDDLDAAVAWYEDIFSPRVWNRTELFGTSLALLVVGDIVMMPMCPPPGVPTAPGRFKERFGQRLHSLALYVDQPVALIDHLRSQGLRLTGSDGRDLRDPNDEFFQPRPSMDDPRLEDKAWSSTYWREEHPLAIQAATYTVVTGDLLAATQFFVDSLEGKVIEERTIAAYGTRSAFIALSDQVVIEVAQPLDRESAARRDLAAGGAFHAVTFRVSDLGRATSHVEGHDVGVEQPGAGHVVLDPADCHGLLIRLTDRDITDW
jgi:catechol 2,3-dioxygenase-like lactoylglutathione lyase family enzyme